jgi:endonuclease I
MYMASASVNNFRSNFRFAELDKTSDAVQERHGSLRLLSKRLFCPYQGRRLIAHTVWSMLDRYEGLEEERIFDDPLTFWSWQRQPWTPIERVMLERQQEFIQKKIHMFWINILMRQVVYQFFSCRAPSQF